ncbi:MAG: hypothetical protein KC983_03500 [Phycisphaerales bacterium]|nr:hypothetical protein [Phycisphaerales bacterium]
MSIDRKSLLMSGAVLLGVAALAPSARGHGRLPEMMPVERVVENLAAAVAEHPDDPYAHYRLGRVHMMALETKTGFVNVFNGRNTITPAEGWWTNPRIRQDFVPNPPDHAQLITHLKEALAHLETAIHMRPGEPAFRLTLACTLEAGEPLMGEVDHWPLLPTDAEVAAMSPDIRRRIFASEAVDGLLKTPPDRAYIEWYLKGRSAARDLLVREAASRGKVPEHAERLEELRQRDWRCQIDRQYFRAMCLALIDDGLTREKPIWGGLADYVAYEAAQDFVRYVEARGEEPFDFIRLRVAKATVDGFNSLPHPNAITPIVLDLDGVGLDALESLATSAFDLEGSGRPQAWSWVSPNVGILVWDPSGEGDVRSGHLLFGSVTWFLPFEHGYEALSTLDDDRDGRIAGEELTGLSVWFDRNQNGVADAGEVQPVGELSIEALSCRVTSTECGMPMSRGGVHLTNGETRDSYDWIATAQRPAAAPDRP